MVHPDESVLIQLLSADTAQERRVIRRRYRRANRYAKIKALRLLDTWLYHRCEICFTYSENPSCECSTTGIQLHMDFTPKPIIPSWIPKEYANYDDFLTFKESPSLLGGASASNSMSLTKELIDATVCQLAENMAYNFDQSINALVELTKDLPQTP